MSLPGADWRERLRQAGDAVRQARHAPPGPGKQTFHHALLLVIAVRNAAQRASPPDSPPRDQLNSLLSLMSSVEFPLGGYHAERMDAIERELEALAAR